MINNTVHRLPFHRLLFLSCNMNIDAAVQINDESFNSILGTKLGSTQHGDPFEEIKFHQRAKMFREIIMWMVQTKAHCISLGMFSPFPFKALNTQYAQDIL